jgi:hypothetical protein
MKFNEIEFDLNFGNIPLEIGIIFKYSFFEKELQSRYQKISGPNFISFVPFGDYWKFIEAWEKDLVFGENGERIDDVIPYYEAYSKGFLDGYFEFENEIKEINLIFNQNSFPIEKIFDEIKSEVYPFTSRGYFYKNDDSKEKPIPIIKKDLLYSGGLKIGRNYKAWFYIIKNPKPFISLFRDFYFESFKLYENEFKKWNSHIKGYKSKLQSIIEEIEKDLSKGTSEKGKNSFESIWQRNPQVSIDDFLQKGFDLGLWDENYNLMSKRGGIYGSGKALLANIYICLKGHSINEEIDHKKIGKVFCNFFNLKIDPIKENQFKQFQKGGNEKQLNELKKRLK